MAVSATGFISAHIVIQGLLLVPMLVVGVLAARKLRQQGDKVRSGIPWFHAALWLTFAGFVFNFLAYVVLLAYSLGEGDRTTAEAIRRLDTLSQLLIIVSGAVLNACISEIAAGVKLAATQASSKAFRIFIFVLVTITTVLMVVYYIYEQYRLTSFYRSYWSGSISTLAFGILGLVAIVLLLVGALAVFIFALVQLRVTRKHADRMHASAGGSVATIASLNFVLYIWGLIVFFLVGFGVPNDPDGLVIADAIIGRWGTFIVLFLIYRLANKSTNGLWSTLPSKHELGAVYNTYQQPSVGHV